MKSPRLQQVRPEVFLSQAGIGRAIVEVPRKLQQFQPEVFLSQAGIGREIVGVPKNKKIFSQGELGEAVFYIQKGRAKLSVVSRECKEATSSLFGPGDLDEEDWIAGLRSTRLAADTATPACP